MHRPQAAPGATVWLTGLPSAGKTTLARALAGELRGAGRAAIALDGDELRAGLCADLGFTPADRAENVRRAADAARLLAGQGILVFVALISPFRTDRRRARALHREAGLRFLEVHVDADPCECARRDPKGLWRRARAGELIGFTGVDAPYEVPERPEVRVDTASTPVGAAVAAILAALDAPPPPGA